MTINLTLRGTKGSPLTHEEMDNNLSGIKQEFTDLAATDSTVPVGGAAAGNVGRVTSLWVTPEMFGAVGDGVTNDASAIANWLSSPLKKIAKKGATYNIGTITGDSYLTTTTGICLLYTSPSPRDS